MDKEYNIPGTDDARRVREVRMKLHCSIITFFPTQPEEIILLSELSTVEGVESNQCVFLIAFGCIA
jgi:hypothetical protein